MVSEHQEDATVLPQKFGGGPYGIGDPEDRSLRKVEKEVMVPKVMRDRAKAEKCFEEVSAFESCCKDSSILMVVKCRKQNDNLKNCLSTWYKNQAFINECTEIYLNERSEFRRTGLQKKYRDYLKNRAKDNSSDNFQ